ncbi:annexin B9-like [Culicoides brevitarsis]|uniref:annexin B9-like n=1 Tax=Culicoides brevitarsis TaxID=469753 RepID=UPI00307B9665
MSFLTLCSISLLFVLVQCQVKDGSNIGQATLPLMNSPSLPPGFGSQRNIPTVIPERPFNPTNTCALLKTALQGVGRDSETIMKILAGHTRDQRFELAATYKSLYGKDLVQEIMREYDGKLQDVIQYLFWPTEKMYAREFREATRGFGTNEEALIEMCVGLEGQELRRVASAYQQMYEKRLEKDVRDDTSGFFQELLVTLLEGRQEDTAPFPFQVPRNTAEALKNLEVGKWDRQKDTIRDVFCKRSFTELRAMFDEYEKQAGHKIEDAIEREFKKDAKKTLLAIVKCARNRSEYFAETLAKAIPSVGVKHDILHRIIVGRSEIDLGNIKEAFYQKYNKNIDVWLKHILEGYYWDLMVQLAGYQPNFFTN